MNENDFKYALVGHRDCMAYSFISCRYVPTKHIAYFLSFFLCLFSLFSYLYVGVPWPWAVNFRWASMDIHDDTGSWEHHFSLFILRFYVIYISCCTMALVCRIFLWTLYLCYVLTMGVFTTSWWVVNQPIVVAMFLIASTGFKTFLSYPWWGGTSNFSYCRSFLSYLWWGETFAYVILLLLLLLLILLLYDYPGLFPCLV